MQTVDLTPTWREILPAVIVMLENPKTKRDALDELTRMAGAADRYVELWNSGRIKEGK